MNLAERMQSLALSVIPGGNDANGFRIGRNRPQIRPYDTAEIRDITDKNARRTARKKIDSERCIAVLDMETDAFDRDNDAIVKPFLVVIYSDQFEPIILWETENHELLMARTIASLEALGEKFTIYAHNGGRFDYMFLLKRLRGMFKFKGRSLMSCRVGMHTLRDSFHIIPERLRNWKKDDFDYDKCNRSVRERFREEITTYCINDCKYLLQIVRRFIRDNGLALSIGQAAIKKLRKEYDVSSIGEHTDGLLRGICTDASDRENYGKRTGKGYFLGGRVECIAGAGRFVGRYKLYDVNSMYPYVMANYRHPIGANYTVRKGLPDENTCFINVTCRNKGALIGKAEDGSTTANIETGTFCTTIHEFTVARDAALISDVVVNHVIDCDRFGNFERFVIPTYVERLHTKSHLASMRARGLKPGDIEYDETFLSDIFLKLYLNNAYGKFAQNPRRFRETCIMEYGEGFIPEGGLERWTCIYQSQTDGYAIWETRGPVWNERNLSYDYEPLRFNNIGTGASITGAARSYLLSAILNAVDPIYCDTDSIICRDLPNVSISKTELGAWDIEKEFDEVIIVGKKQYAARLANTKVNARTGLPTRRQDYIVRHKGVADVSWRDMVDLLNDELITKKSPGATITKFGTQYYLKREIRRTAPRHNSLLGNLKYGTAV